ncbi:MAG: hypothetical protein KF852_11590 [Saprospiraceae bacterium]|nr:hypothetical protein [Saprospiraceae bacterium]
MKKHHGMRPHDILILLKIAAKPDDHWLMKDLAIELGISFGEVSESLQRSAYAGLISSDKKSLMKMSLLEFLEYGFKYVYPQHPGAIVRGMPTAFSCAPLSNFIQSDEQVVWPWEEGTTRGQSIEPLHPNVPKACLKDPKLYALLSLADALRIGKAREKQIASQQLKELVL